MIMNSMDFDVDSSGGLMPQILALTAPPGTRDANRQLQSTGSSGQAVTQLGTNGNLPPEAGLAAHPYFKRPGRGHNHDSCDACGEGGDLICCDLCPASFHLACHDPPLDENEIPLGEWACHQCRVTGGVDERSSNSNGRSNKNSKGVKKKEKDENNRKVFASGREFEISDSPLATLVKAAATVNPKQFILPYELTLPANFPGEPKETLKKNGSRRNFSKKKPYELDNGLVPLPAKLCFQCNKSCRVGPLIPCDYCPLFFHLDCLNPPLTVPPMGRWMCPNHPEHTLDATILTSHSLTERVKLWDKFTTPVDQHSVKVDFFQRCHRTNPPFRYKVKKALRSRIRVPSSIKAHYQDPPDLLPHLSPSQYIPIPPPFSSYSEAPVTNNVQIVPKSTSPSPLANTTESEDKTSHSIENEIKEEAKEPEDNSSDLYTVKESLKIKEEKVEDTKMQSEQIQSSQEERNEWLTGLLQFQSSIVKHISMNEGMKSSESSQSNSLDTRPSCLNGDVISHDSKTKKHSIDGKRGPNTTSYHPSQSSLYYSGSKKGILKTQKGKISTAPILKSSKSKKASPSEILKESLESLSHSLKEKIQGNGISINSLDMTIVEILACERLQQLMSPSEPEIIVSNPHLPARALLCPLVPDIKIKDMAPKKKYSNQPIPMMFRVFNIGKGSHNHVNLELFGHCNFVSAHHASIIFDETTGHYELLNYSEHTTKVDGVSYFCDFSEKTISHATPAPMLQQVKAIIAQRRGLKPCDQISSPPPAMNSQPGEDLFRCNCKRLTSKDNKGQIPNIGWEGAAALHHGSYIKFGCLQFVFSIVEEASKGDWAQDALVVYEKFIKKEEEEREEEKFEKEMEIDKEKEKKTKKDDKNPVKL